MGTVYVDADACPVKDEVYTVADRHGWPVVVVANRPILVPRDDGIRLQLVPDGPDAADDWIAERATAGDVVVTADVPLAARCVKTGAAVIPPAGKPFTPDSIGMALAMRDLMTDLRSAGATTPGQKPFSREDRSRFLAALHQAMVRIARGEAGRSA